MHQYFWDIWKYILDTHFFLTLIWIKFKGVWIQLHAHAHFLFFLDQAHFLRVQKNYLHAKVPSLTFSFVSLLSSYFSAKGKYEREGGETGQLGLQPTA